VARATALALLLVLYAWWASGVRPFSALGYALIAIDSLAVVILLVVWAGLSSREFDVHDGDRIAGTDSSLAHAWPWLALVVLAVALEVVGLALGGRSTTVPTLSTTIDHLLVTHVVRWLLYMAWLAVGATPLVRRWQRRHRVAPR
jgi:hypothetical protein